MKEKKCVIERASKYSHAKKGYFVFVNSPKAIYGILKHKYFKSKKQANNYCKKINK